MKNYIVNTRKKYTEKIIYLPKVDKDKKNNNNIKNKNEISPYNFKYKFSSRFNSNTNNSINEKTNHKIDIKNEKLNNTEIPKIYNDKEVKEVKEIKEVIETKDNNIVNEPKKIEDITKKSENTKDINKKKKKHKKKVSFNFDKIEIFEDKIYIDSPEKESDNKNEKKVHEEENINSIRERLNIREKIRMKHKLINEKKNKNNEEEIVNKNIINVDINQKQTENEDRNNTSNLSNVNNVNFYKKYGLRNKLNKTYKETDNNKEQSKNSEIIYKKIDDKNEEGINNINKEEKEINKTNYIIKVNTPKKENLYKRISYNGQKKHEYNIIKNEQKEESAKTDNKTKNYIRRFKLKENVSNKIIKINNNKENEKNLSNNYNNKDIKIISRKYSYTNKNNNNTYNGTYNNTYNNNNTTTNFSKDNNISFNNKIPGLLSSSSTNLNLKSSFITYRKNAEKENKNNKLSFISTNLEDEKKNSVIDKGINNYIKRRFHYKTSDSNILSMNNFYNTHKNKNNNKLINIKKNSILKNIENNEKNKKELINRVNLSRNDKNKNNIFYNSISDINRNKLYIGDNIKNQSQEINIINKKEIDSTIKRYTFKFKKNDNKYNNDQRDKQNQKEEYNEKIINKSYKTEFNNIRNTNNNDKDKISTGKELYTNSLRGSKSSFNVFKRYTGQK